MSNKAVKEQVNQVVLDDVSTVYTIKNKRGKVLGEFVFRPSDTQIAERYEEVVKFFDHLQIPDNSYESIRAVEKQVIEKIGYLIGEEAANTFFNIIGPFSLLESGKFFVEEVLEAIASVIEQEMEIRIKRMRRRVNKYSSKYHK